MDSLDKALREDIPDDDVVALRDQGTSALAHLARTVMAPIL